MTYEYENDVISELEQMGVDYQSNGYFNMSIEVQEVYRKAKAWDRMYEMLIDKDMPSIEFDNEMYELLKQTGKTNIRIITDSNINMEDE